MGSLITELSSFLSWFIARECACTHVHPKVGTVGGWREGVFIPKVEESWSFMYTFLELHVHKDSPMSKEKMVYSWHDLQVETESQSIFITVISFDQKSQRKLLFLKTSTLLFICFGGTIKYFLISKICLWGLRLHYFLIGHIKYWIDTPPPPNTCKVESPESYTRAGFSVFWLHINQAPGWDWAKRNSSKQKVCDEGLDAPHCRRGHVFYLQTESSFKRVRHIYFFLPMVWSLNRTLANTDVFGKILKISFPVSAPYPAELDTPIYKEIKLQQSWKIVSSLTYIWRVFLINSEINLTFAQGRPVCQVLRAVKGQSVLHGKWHLFCRMWPALWGPLFTDYTSPYLSYGLPAPWTFCLSLTMVLAAIDRALGL